MLPKYISHLGIMSMLMMAGCVIQRSDIAWPKPRPLGRDIMVYRPPKDPPPPYLEPVTLEESMDVISLRDALALALMHNPELKAFSWEIRVAEARVLQASLLPNPEIGVEIEEIGGTGKISGFDGAETTLQLGQLIELAGKRIKRTKVASLESELVGWDYEAKRLDVLTHVTRVFVEVLAAQERLALAMELVRLSDQVYSTVSQRVEAGKDAGVEKIKAEVVLSIVQIKGKQAAQHLESARKQLAATWAGHSPIFERAKGQFEAVSPIPSAGELEKLVEQNPDIARWAVTMEHRRAALELEKARAIQDPIVGGGAQWFNETDDSAFVLGVSVPLPLFNHNQGNILEARYKLARALEDHKAVEAFVRSSLAQAYQRLSNAFTEATEMKKKVLPGAQRVFDAVTEGYRTGKFEYLEVLDAQRTLFASKGLYIEALATYHIARAEVERFIGQSISEINEIQNPRQKESQ